jgi:hypothetical protein
MAAKEKAEPTQESQAQAPKQSKGTRRAQAKPQDVKAQSQEAKDLRSLMNSLNQKNSPDTSKEITAFAKETIKLVQRSQKSESAAFRREATKALVDFRNFVETTSKVSELRRTQLMNQIDGITLDTKNASFMLLSVAKTQAKNVKLSAQREAQAKRLEIKEMEKRVLEEATAKAKALEDETRLKSKAFREEQEQRLKAIADERHAKHKAWIEATRNQITEQKDKLKTRREAHKLEIEQRKADLVKQKQDSKLHFQNLAAQLKQTYDARNATLQQQRLKQQADLAQQSLDLKQARADAAAKITKLKSDLRTDHQMKMRQSKADLAQRRGDMLQKNKERINKIREMTVEHRAKLKKIEEESRTEVLLRKRAVQKAIAEDERREAATKQRRSELGNKVKAGIFEANPLLHAATEIFVGMGLHDIVANRLKKHREKKEQAKLNKLNHTASSAPKAATAASGGSGTPSGASASPAQVSGSGGGMFDGILGLLPSVSGILSGIGSMFTGIVGAFARIGPMLLNGARFLPGIAQVAAIIGGIWKFVEGFNDATSLFGDKVQDDDYVRRIFSGFTNVFASILGIFDTVAGWLGFDTDLAGGFKKGAVKVFNAIINTFKSLVGGLADLLDFIPGMGDKAKALRKFADSPTLGDFAPSQSNTAAALNDKTSTVNSLQDDLEARRMKSASVQVVQDNSVKQNSTTLVQAKLDTRNKDSTSQMYGYGAPQGSW